ncbi:MAG: molecular chaperone HtpG [Alphaproteobacteria bacterium]|nr:molecular chaperone HtpG [Alphaproteobacteria bacterium]
MTVKVKPQKQTLKFQAEINQLLHLVTHSLYNNKEVFLRELISNASDALDKLRFSALSKNDLYENDPDLKIHIKIDKDNNTLTIIDNGIGMTRAEVIENLGMIAKSGTQRFLDQLAQGKSDVNLSDINFIGQFGVGFYSAFMVADKVTVKSRAAGSSEDEGVRWESSGTGEYVIQNMKKPQRGTEIVLHLKKEYFEFLEEARLKHIITKYSDHIPWPIMMGKRLEVTNQEGSKEDGDIQAVAEEVVNQATALWRLPKNTITEEQYKEFYKHLSHDFSEPLVWSHNVAEGKQEYISLFYIPSRAPYDLWHQDAQHGLKLYINHVFILEGANQFLPQYLRFVRGIIDSSDLPLNVSREYLQTSPLVSSIKKVSTKKIIALLEKMAEGEKDKYRTFWSEFGLTLKEGIIEDYENREQLAKLLRFSTTRSDQPETSLKNYLDQKLETQEEIYYIIGKNLETIKNTPHLEAFKEKGIEVLFLTDRIDEWLISHLSEFEGKKLKSITNSDTKLDWVQDAENNNKEDENKIDDTFSDFLSRLKDTLKGKVKDIQPSHRLTTFPVCFVSDSSARFPFNPLKNEDNSFSGARSILEVNPKHPLIHKIKGERDDGRFEQWANILYDQAILSEGKNLSNPTEYVQRINTLLLELMN